jgi:2-(1,2-epoxy-1,2-dihydrophenyl)acetyl-CoA isomerase
MVAETVLYNVADGVVTLTLNRPEKLNAFGGTMREELAAAVERADADDGVRALIITGAGRAFCSGADLGDRIADLESGASFDSGEILDKIYNPLVRRIAALEIPVIAAVNGVAAGAGANIALACDIVIAARSASFIQAFCRIGLVPDAGGSYHLPRLIGRARAMGLTLLGDALDAETAHEWGLIWAVADDDALMAEATGIARRLAQGPTLALGLIKKAMNASEHNTLAEQLDLERDLQRIAGASEDFREGIAAFVEKRRPAFKGK